MRWMWNGCFRTGWTGYGPCWGWLERVGRVGPHQVNANEKGPSLLGQPLHFWRVVGYKSFAGQRMTLNRCTVFTPFTVMFTMYTPLAMPEGSCRMVVKRSPLLPYVLANACFP